MKYGAVHTKEAQVAKAGGKANGASEPGYAYVMWTSTPEKRWYNTPYEAAKSLESYIGSTLALHPLDKYSIVKCPDHLVTDPASPTQVDVTIKGRLKGPVSAYLEAPHTSTKAPVEEEQYVVPFAKVKDPSDSNLF